MAFGRWTAKVLMSKPHRTALGRGLSALIPDATARGRGRTRGHCTSATRVHQAADNQPRTRFDDNALRTLADSIEKDGLIRPSSSARQATIPTPSSRASAATVLKTDRPGNGTHAHQATDEEESYDTRREHQRKPDPLEEADRYQPTNMV